MNGLEKLKLEGRLEERAEMTYKTVKGALKLGMDAKTIADTFELNSREVKKIIQTIQQQNG